MTDNMAEKLWNEIEDLARNDGWQSMSVCLPPDGIKLDILYVDIEFAAQMTRVMRTKESFTPMDFCAPAIGVESWREYHNVKYWRLHEGDEESK